MMCELTDIVKLLMFKIMYKLFHRLLRSFRDKLGKHLIFFFSFSLLPEKTCEFQELVKPHRFNPFVPNEPFLYPLKISENLNVF